MKSMYTVDHSIYFELVYFCVFCVIIAKYFIAKVMIYARDALIDLFALTRFLIPVAFTDIAVDVGEQVSINGNAVLVCINIDYRRRGI